MLGTREVRSPEEGWPLQREKYAAWLAQLESFCLLAEIEGRSVGYAMVTVTDGLQGWRVGDRIADVQSLSILPEARQVGVGGRLMDAVEDELRRRGIEDVRLLVVTGNREAIGFYERRGMTTISHVMLGRVDG